MNHRILSNKPYPNHIRKTLSRTHTTAGFKRCNTSYRRSFLNRHLIPNIVWHQKLKTVTKAIPK